MLESFKHSANGFVTLTYDDGHLPELGTLVPRHLQLFLKRLRRALPARPLRFFGVGEYGETSQRPHYHLATFGLGPEDAPVVQNAWGYGFTFVGDLTNDSAQYVAGYVTKKMTHPESSCTELCTHPKLSGRHPEFARMSLRPGVGASAVTDIWQAYAPHLSRLGDVPQTLSHGKKELPLGRYLRRKLRELSPDPQALKESAVQKYALEMYLLQKEAWLKDPSTKNQAYKTVLLNQNIQQVRNIESRFRVFKHQKGKI